MRTFSQKPKTTQLTTSTKSSLLGRTQIGQGHDPNSIVNLQRTIGNQALLQLLRNNAEESNGLLTGTALPHLGHDFTRTPVSPPMAGALQTKRTINKPGNEYEQEADRVADQVMRMPEPQLQRTCVYGGGCSKHWKEQGIREAWQAKPAQQNGAGDLSGLPIMPKALRSPALGLDLTSRDFMESRFGHDFDKVRIHTGALAAESAQSLGARAFTVGKDIVFGDCQYRPHHTEGRRLLTHELTHVRQQGSAGRPTAIRALSRVPVVASGPQIQRSPLSDSLRAAHAADSSLEALLARLAQSDIQNAQTDTDIDAELVSILAGRAGDLWVAQQIRQGRLIENSGSFGPQTMPRNPIPVHFFRGTTNRRALVVAGVHGSEVQGIEVARHLISDLQTGMAATPPRLPAFSTIIVPTLFPGNAATRSREGATQTNRNFPDPRHSLATAPRDIEGHPLAAPATPAGRPRAVATQRPILTQNILLMALIERFNPERIISIHGTWRSGAGGVFYDPRQLTPAEYREARQYAAGMAYMSVLPEEHNTPEGQRRLREFERRFFLTRLNEMAQRASQTDENLSLATARAIHAATASITGRGGRQFANREGEPQPVPIAQVAARRLHPSVAGNVGASGNLDTAYWSGNSPPGYSLGGYASERGMSIFTVEPPLNCTTTDYQPGGSCAGRASGVSEAERRTELMSYAEAIRTVLLGT